MTPKRTGEFAGAPSAPLQSDSSEAAKKSSVSSRRWPMLNQHLSLNQEIPGGWRAGKERRLKIKRT